MTEYFTLSEAGRGSVVRCVSLFAALLVTSSVVMAASATHSSPRNLASEHTLSGVWWIENFAPQLLPADGSAIPFTANGLQRYEQNRAGLGNGSIEDLALTRCLPEVLPRALNSAYPLQIAQHGKLVTVLHEANHGFWHALMNGQHPDEDDIDPTFMGNSVATWQDNTLVIDTLGFKAKSLLDITGLPHGDQLHVVTRLRKLSSQQLEALITIEDPEFFSRAWTVRRSYELRPDVQLMEFVCGEAHRYLPGNRRMGVLLNGSAK